MPTGTVSVSSGTLVASVAATNVDAAFKVFITPNWDTAGYYVSKATNGFVVNFGTIAGSGAEFDWETIA